MRNYYVADTHFGHANVIRFDRRPFADVDEMENVICHNWNAAVWKDDVVYIIGDYCWNKADEWIRITKRLHGQKVLVVGNHDLKQMPSELRRLFADVKEAKVVDDNGRKVQLRHYPEMFYNHANNPNYYMLCGHVHTTAENTLLEKWRRELKARSSMEGPDFVPNLGQIYNVGCMMPYMGYTPRTLDEIIHRHAEYERRQAIHED